VLAIFTLEFTIETPVAKLISIPVGAVRCTLVNVTLEIGISGKPHKIPSFAPLELSTHVVFVIVIFFQVGSSDIPAPLGLLAGVDGRFG
jgi:hypothetical protein